MQKTLKWKFLLILAFLAICVYLAVSPKEKGGKLLSRLNLGLDLKGGIHLVLQVVTDDATNQELNQDAQRVAEELKGKNIAFESSKKGNGQSIEVAGVDSAQEKDARLYFESTYNSKYGIRSTAGGGKTSFSLAPLASYLRETQDSTVQQALETIRRRVDALGVSEPNLQIYGGSGKEVQDQIIVELPGIDDPDRVKSLIENTAQLELRLVKKENGGPFSSIDSALQANNAKISDDYQIIPYRDDTAATGGNVEYLVVNRLPVITGKHLKNARRSADSNGSPAVSFFLNSEGADLFSRATEQHVGDKLAIVLDNVASSAPVINERIGAEGIINGRFTIQQAEDLALLLRSGALPASLRVLEERSVGASLGNDAIRAGIMASLIGFGMVVLIMVVYYKHAGVNAIYCLMANLIILMGFMGALGATLTLPGIAGVILTIGMATDSNILIFERIREELRTGKTIRAAIDTSFKRVFWTIVDTHLCTLIAAAFLFQFGTGPIRGFAVTLTVGLIANMFTAVYFSHRLFDLMLGGKKLEKLSI
ncbi:MAG: preprotein translocase subunit SecD [Acidobacteria bacterium]|nr:preprotein translocase subunit SecD [Acidobacteriota bacterium]